MGAWYAPAGAPKGFPRGKQSARFALPCVPLVVCLNDRSLTAFGGYIHWIPASLRSPLHPLRAALGASSPVPITPPLPRQPFPVQHSRMRPGQERIAGEKRALTAKTQPALFHAVKSETARYALPRSRLSDTWGKHRSKSRICRAVFHPSPYSPSYLAQNPVKIRSHIPAPKGLPSDPPA